MENFVVDNNNTNVLGDLYGDYRNVIKPLLAEIEANYQKFPTALLNEIRAFNDHISRCYYQNTSEEEISKQLEKARSHIDRMILDCYKYLNVYYSDKIKKIEKQIKNIDITSIDNGEFYINYSKLKQEAINKVKVAKKEENKTKINSFQNYEQSYNAYTELDDFVTSNLSKIMWARAKFYTNKIVVAIIWVLSLIGTSLLTNNNQKIVDSLSTFIWKK